MNENTGSYKIKFKDHESKMMKTVMFHVGERTIDGVNYTFETFFNSGIYNIKEVMFMPLDGRVAYVVWYMNHN